MPIKKSNKSRTSEKSKAKPRSRKPSHSGIQGIIARDLPEMRIVKRKRSPIVVQADAKIPTASAGGAAPHFAPDTGDDADDDVQIVNVEPKSRARRDSASDADQVVLVSKSKKKIVAMRG